MFTNTNQCAFSSDTSLLYYMGTHHYSQLYLNSHS